MHVSRKTGAKKEPCTQVSNKITQRNQPVKNIFQKFSAPNRLFCCEIIQISALSVSSALFRSLRLHLWEKAAVSAPLRWSLRRALTGLSAVFSSFPHPAEHPACGSSRAGLPALSQRNSSRQAQNSAYQFSEQFSPLRDCRSCWVPLVPPQQTV